jgi:DNA topoisomerase I
MQVDSIQTRLRGLVYVTDESPGIRRIRRGHGFVYRTPDGRLLRDEAQLQRIRSLVIPPAWRDVWICPRPNGHLQATGRDARGRKQHRYHPRWTAVRDQAKYARMLTFAEALPVLRRRTEADLAVRGLPRRKVIAAVVQLLEKTLIRIGNDEYAKQNRSFGLTTIEDRHAAVHGAGMRFRFRGKSGKPHDVQLTDPRLARIVKQCQELPGSQLFQYVDEQGRVRDITSSDVNAYLRSATGHAFTAKDFRTWAGTILAALALDELDREAVRGPSEKQVVQAVDAVSQLLNNTRSVCRKCYVHPMVIEAYLDGTLQRSLHTRSTRRNNPRISGLSPFEMAVVGLLRQRAKRAKVDTRHAA